jgi:type III pantothenate kinase
MSWPVSWLLIDVGNTRIKWAKCGPHNATDSLAPMHASFTADELIEIAQYATQHHLQRAMISNVAGSEIETRLTAALRASGVETINIVTSMPFACGVTNRYSRPSQLGSDRFAALIGAHQLAALVDQAKLVVVAGTALTIDALTASGEFLGGVIVPGVTTMRKNLSRDTAQLPDVNVVDSLSEAAISAFPRDTDSAIATGTLEAALGAISLRAGQLRGQLKQFHQNAHLPLNIVLSGGGAAFLADAIIVDADTRLHVIPDLVLRGLAALTMNATLE